ncbi:hypothetical protein [Chenggangzhangella methanolivorans]|uniref:Uncharacterized protein n=1 Tax=Chenggangzhangella methanolivorans TaxID=1437009 RepID=A0A9E6UMW2_9HYPH|nr:hypothetical protein [Chenggangzhangella methanolivorans]QZN99568.1 hypothetical protein K6K41_23130 [Chenggangzhangella methanolivorans]
MPLEHLEPGDETVRHYAGKVREMLTGARPVPFLVSARSTLMVALIERHEMTL